MTERKATRAELQQALQRLNGLRTWNSRAGSGTGSIFTLEFGEVLPERAGQGELSLMVSCAWRLNDRQQIMCTWHDDADSVLATCLALLHEARVIEVTLSSWGDLQLQFSNSLVLDVFADLSVRQIGDDNWLISVGQDYYSWNTDYTVSLQCKD